MNILDIKEELEKKIKEFFKVEFQTEIENIVIEIPDLQFGDLTTNVCLQESQNLKLSPIQLAEKLKNFLEQSLTLAFSKGEGIVQKIEIRGPGFINFYVKGGGEAAAQIPTKYFGKKVLVEHSSPNLFKPFHIGHLVNNFIGEFIVRAMKEAHADVTTISYPSDISIGIAKAIYILKQENILEF